jgi:hypothetical protein
VSHFVKTHGDENYSVNYVRSASVLDLVKLKRLSLITFLMNEDKAP